VLAPPYDVITPPYRDELYARDAHNVVRLVLSRAPDDAGYLEAGDAYRRWQAEGLLAPDPEPSLYLLEQAFGADGRSLRRYGLLARFKAEGAERGSILPHEQTRSAPREDRYRMLKATRANFSPIFLMFADSGRFAARVATVIADPPDVVYADDAGTRHRLWRVGKAGDIAAFSAALADTRAYIADGHHRYATALRYRDELGPDGAWTYGYFTPLDAPGLIVQPYHRILADGPGLDQAREALGALFLVSDAEGVRQGAATAAHSTMPYAFALSEPGGRTIVAEALPEAEDLVPAGTPACLGVVDAFFVHQVVLPRLLAVPPASVGYVHSLQEAEDELTRRACRLAILMRPTPIRQIMDVAEARESMPAKSTFFHPKLPSGLVIHPLVV